MGSDDVNGVVILVIQPSVSYVYMIWRMVDCISCLEL
jgi:hypothetical protein